MGVSARYLKKALAQVKAGREREQLNADSRLIKMYADYPRLKQLDNEIKSVFIRATRETLNGKNGAVEEAANMSLELQRQRNEYISENNIDKNMFLPKYKCDKCEDTGYFNGKMCACVKKLASKMIYDEINANVPLEQCTFESFELDKYSVKPNKSGIVPRDIMTKISCYCMKYADEFNAKSKSLLFFGETGLGKTHLSLAIANDVIKKGYDVIYGPISHIIKCIEDEHFSRADAGNYTLDSVINCDLLILDDLGTEFTTQFVTSTMYDIVNSRILNGKPTIINTNLDFEELEKKYTPRLVSRISGCYKLFQFFGEDIRTQIK